MLINILAVLVFLYLIPCLVGVGISRILKIDSTVVKSFLVGNIFIWAIFQLITVPLVLRKQSFFIVVVIITIITFGISISVILDEVVRKKCANLAMSNFKNEFSGIKIEDAIAFIMMLGMLGGLLYKIITLQHTDADDSRFVVNAVEIVRTNKMFLVDVITGNDIGTWMKEISKDVTSPWAVYIAYYAKMTGIPVVIFAHSVLPISLILSAMSAFWLMSKELFGDRLSNRSIFMYFVILLNLHGYFTRNSAETFLLSRIWQGKGTVAGVAIPTMFLLGLWLYGDEKKYGNYIMLGLLDIGMCLMSGMGIVIGAIFLGVFGLAYGIIKRNWKTMLILWSFCIPNVVYYILYLKYQVIPW